MELKLSKNQKRIIAIILVSIALILEFLEFIHDSLVDGFVLSRLGLIFYIVFLLGGLVIALACKRLKGIIFLLTALKVFDSVYFTYISLRKFEKDFVNHLQLTSDIIFAVAVVLLFLSFLMSLIFTITDKQRVHKWVLIFLLFASIVMFIGSIINLAGCIKETMKWIAFIEPLSLSILFLGLYFGWLYAEEEHKTIQNDI